MKTVNDKAIKYGSVITIDHQSDKSGILLCDGFVDTSIYFSKPKRNPNMSLARGLFIILPAFGNDVKVIITTYRSRDVLSYFEMHSIDRKLTLGQNYRTARRIEERSA